jgi:hypothetical protein
MSADEASSNTINDQIIRLFLYGNANGLSSYTNEAVIRPDDATTTIALSALAYKDGPGRFAMPELFESVREFFNLSIDDLLALKLPDGSGIWTDRGPSVLER